MVEKLSVQIALEGGQEVQRQLADIGAAGQKAFAQIEQSATQVGGFKNLKPEEVTASLKAMGIEGTAAFDKIQAAVAKASNFEKVVVGLTTLENGFAAAGKAALALGGVAIPAIVAAMTAAIKATINFAAAVNKVSEAAIKVGQSFQSFVKLRTELEKLGLSGAEATSGIENFTKSLEKIKAKEIADDLEATRKKLEGLGFTVKQFPPDPLQAFRQATQQAAAELPRFIEQLRQMPDSAERSALAIERLGTAAGTALIQSLRLADPALSQTERSAILLEQAIKRLSDSWDRFGSLTIAPQLTTGINAVTSALGGLGALLNSIGWGAFGTAASVALNPLPNLLELLGAAILKLGSQLTGITWDKIKSGAETAWGAVVTAIQGAVTAVADFASKITDITWDAIKNAGVSAWNALTAAIQEAIDKLLKFIGLKPDTSAPGGSAPGKAAGGLLGGRGTGTSDSNLAWVSRGEHIMPARVVAQPGVLGFLEALRRGGSLPRFAEGGPFIRGVAESSSSLGNEISNWIVKIAEANNSTREALQQVVNSINTLADGLTTKLFDVVRDMTNKLNVLAAAGALASGKAAGGLLGGRGTGTSDSNLAWLSRGEYITPAAAVAQPGVLAFLEALRRSGGNLTAVLNGMGQFALGGMVPRMPAFASGGLAGGSHVTIQFPGLPAISGLRASSDVVEQLHRAAALAQVRSGGRKPSRYS